MKSTTNKSTESKNSTNVRRRPIKSRSIRNLSFLTDTEYHQQKRLNAIKLARKMSPKNPGDDDIIYFKEKATEFEAYCAAICRLIATATYVPSVKAYYENETFKGVGSKELKGFVSNSENPLCIEDTIVESKQIKLEQQYNKLALIIYKILKTLPSQYYLQSQAQCLYTSLFHSETLAHFKASLLNFVNNRENRLNLDDLLQILNDRKPNASLKEAKYITRAIDIIDQTKIISGEYTPHNLSIEEFELLTQKINNSDFEWSSFLIENVKNYQTLSGLAVGLTTRYIFKERDNNGTNIEKDGRFIDFGKTKENIHFDLREKNIINELMRPTENAFICTENDVRQFPNVKDADLYFWPTIQTKTATIVVKAIQSLLNNTTQLADPELTKSFMIDLVTNIAAVYYNPDNIPSSFYDKLKDYVGLFALAFKGLLENKNLYTVISEHRRTMILERIKNDLLRLIDQSKDMIDVFESQVRSLLGNGHYSFSELDNKVYKSLATNPIFIFHKFKTFLKYILSDENMYQELANLYISEDKNKLRGEAVQDEIKRIDEIKGVLVKMPEFKQFLLKHGNFALELIKDEFQQAGLGKTVDSSMQLSRGINLDAITERYNDIYLATCNEKPSTHHSYAMPR